MKMKRLVWLTSAIIWCVPEIAVAQAPETQDRAAGAAGSPSLGEIVVTARRQAERVRDVPISIIAVDGKTLQEKAIRTANDLPQVAAGLSVQNTSGNRSDTTFSIRGQGQTFGQSSPGVVTYFADVPDFATQIYDLENIQVLKGPQGTLFGRNTEGGAVLFVPRKPTSDFNGFVLTRLGQYDRRDVEFGVGGGLLGDKVMFRVSGQMLRRDGYTKNLYNDTWTDNENKKSIRASLVLRPTDWLENYTIYQYSKVDEAGAGVSIGGYDPTNTNTAPFHDELAAQLAAQLARGPRRIDVDYPLSNGMISKGVINTTTAQIGEHLTLKNIFSTRDFKSRNDYELDGTTLPLLQDHVPYTPQTERTEEVQAQGHFGILQATVGYFNEKDTSKPAIGFDVIEYINPIGPIHAINYGFGGKNTSKAVYGEATVKPTDKLALTAGIRRTTDFRSAGSRTDVVYPFGVVPGTPIEASGTFRATTWNLNALYKITHDLNAYVTARRGYKSGGFNGTALTAADEYFKPETVTDYEAGVKYSGRIGGWRLRADVDIFHDDYKNIQRYVNLATSPPSTVTRNAAAGKISGIDIDVQVAPNSIFDLSVKYTYLHAKYDSYMDPTLGDLSNSRFPNTPKSQLNIVPRITFPVPENIGQVTLQGNIYYQSLIAFDPANVLNGNPGVAISVPGSTAPAYTRYDIRADWHNVMKSRFSVAAYVRNLTNKTYITGSDNQLPSFAGVVTYLYGEPRMFAVELRYDF